MSKPRFLITGGAGFIGSNIARALTARGWPTRVIDNFSTGFRRNLDDIAGKIDIIEGDITRPSDVRKAMDGVDIVLHQAALNSVPRSLNDPVATNCANIEGTLNILMAARDNRVKRVVYAGSSSVYGDAVTDSKVETLPPNPISPYALTKYAGEKYCQYFTRYFGLETVVLRYFNVFGPLQNPAGDYAAVIPKFITQILNGTRPTIYGDGNQRRDFTFVANNVEANILAATAPGAAGEVFNIACGQSVSLNEIFEMICAELNSTLQPIYAPPRHGDVKDSKASIAKARRVLGYKPQVQFAQGLKETIAWFKQHQPQ